MCHLVSSRQLSSLGQGLDIIGNLRDFKMPSLQVLLLNQKSALLGREVQFSNFQEQLGIRLVEVLPSPACCFPWVSSLSVSELFAMR